MNAQLKLILFTNVFFFQEPLEYVRAVANYITRESTLLSFRKGDVIQVVRDEQYVDKGKDRCAINDAGRWLVAHPTAQSKLFRKVHVEFQKNGH